MSKIPLWKWVVAIAPLVGSIVILFLPQESSATGLAGLNVKLGLDLRGGIHMVMQVRTDDAIRTEVDAAEARLRHALSESGAAFERIERPTVTELQVLGVADAARESVQKVLTEQLPQWSITPGAGGLRATMGSVQEANLRDQAVTDVLAGVRERVDKWGIAEANTTRQGTAGSDRILVQLPGVDDPARVKNLITEPAFLEWKMLVSPPGQTPGNFGGAPSRERVVELFGGSLPDGVEVYSQVHKQVNGSEVQSYWPLEKISAITGNDLEDAQRSGDEFGKPAVSFRLKPPAGQRFAKLTRENVGRQMAILLDAKVISAPHIQSEIPSGHGIITGHFTSGEADDLAFKLRSGALRAGVSILEERTIGPSLGADSIRKGLVSGLVGLLLTTAFLLVWYRGSGLNALVVLALQMVLILGVMSAFGATLTLPGIAGYILTMGMAVDANVLIFERIREELRVGKTVRSAVDAGFDKAFSAILDSNLTTLISAVALFSYGTGPIKGFAVTLSVGLLANMFTAVFVSRLLFDIYLGLKPRLQRLSI
jgi:preprotein translocase subunit SecD